MAKNIRNITNYVHFFLTRYIHIEIRKQALRKHYERFERLILLVPRWRNLGLKNVAYNLQ